MNAHTCSMTVYCVQSIGICNRHLSWADPHVFPVFLVCGIEDFKAPSEASMVDELSAGEGSRVSAFK